MMINDCTQGPTSVATSGDTIVTAGDMETCQFQGTEAFQIGQNSAGPPASDNVLKYRTAENGSGDDAYKLTIQAGITYRLQLINTSVDSDLRVHLDNHPFSVIGTDFVPLVPNITSYIQIGIGEQLDVNAGEGHAVITYSGPTVADPTSTAPPFMPYFYDCRPRQPNYQVLAQKNSNLRHLTVSPRYHLPLLKRSVGISIFPLVFALTRESRSIGSSNRLSLSPI
ncbi:hypothetical protein LEMA_P006370.1 [Plenodomus lingam JN3]|uniref:Plastocyanin-like domain-containing protein n=1 Tax=Leptosphaeria maculans (strain JN3 / isolate v23.1.3 / race Av1-4-5-6-7-8) TaxID=985895 RepID=E5AF61_LEPMJ|nr:hypothetical protein LEMA_P006370.1 [Plenodomus lingam JN3]CBY01850.1 hypothetical protein LEMA_P006370.1 [Plenodomus lingam JN3]